MSITDSIREYVQEKASKLERYFDRIQSVEVVIGIDGGSPTAEVVVTAARRGRFVATHRAEDMYACIDKALHKVEEQIRRHKDRVRDRKGPTHEAQLQQASAAKIEQAGAAESKQVAAAKGERAAAAKSKQAGAAESEQAAEE